MGVSLGLRVPPAAIEVDIDELVLHGFAAAGRRQIGDAVEQELARLLSERGWASLPASSMKIERLDAGQFTVAVGARPPAIGARLAQNLHRSLGPRVPRLRAQAKQGRKNR